MPSAASQREAKEGKGQNAVGPIRNRGSFVYRGEFRNSIEDMMYAFGDVEKPEADSLALMEDMTVSFLVDLCHRARPNPSKIPIPSNQNTINTIAAGLFQQGEGLESTATESGASANQASGGRRAIVSIKDRTKEAKTASSSNVRSTMPPRLAPHPYVARPRMTVEDLKFACRKDAKMSSRIEELLYLDKVITAAQKAFDNPEEDIAEKNAA